MYNAIVTPYYAEDGALEIKLDSEPGNLDIYYTFDNTDPRQFHSEIRNAAPDSEKCNLAAYRHLSGQQADRKSDNTDNQRT